MYSKTDLHQVILLTHFFFFFFPSTQLVLVVLYDVFFHPLAGIPGPFFAKITDLWHAHQMTTGVRHKLLYQLHKKYGPLVRIGPNTISVDSVEGLNKIYSATSPIDKSPFYQSFTPGFKSSFASTGTFFKEKKSILAQAFSQKKLDAMEASFMHHTRSLLDVLKTDEKAELDESLSAFTVDILSDVCFGETFDLLHRPQEKKRISRGLEDATKYVALVRNQSFMNLKARADSPFRKGPFGDGPSSNGLSALSPTSSQRVIIRQG
jgi:hypothetical protein